MGLKDRRDCEICGHHLTKYDYLTLGEDTKICVECKDEGYVINFQKGIREKYND